DAQAGGAGLGRLDAAAIMEVDVGDDRHAGGADDGPQGRGRGLVGAGDADDVGPGGLERADLVDGRPGVGGGGVGHRLDGDRRVAADLDRADADLARGAALDGPPGTDV